MQIVSKQRYSINQLTNINWQERSFWWQMYKGDIFSALGFFFFL